MESLPCEALRPRIGERRFIRLEPRKPTEDMRKPVMRKRHAESGREGASFPPDILRHGDAPSPQPLFPAAS